MRLLAFAHAHSPERAVTLGVLALRPRRYIGEGIETMGPPIPGLSIRSTRCDEEPTYHPESGIYGFLRLPAGRNRFHIIDPRATYLERAIEVDVPDRSEVQVALEHGIDPSPELPGVRYAGVAMRPSISYPSTSGETVVWGQVGSNQGHPMPYTGLQIETRFKAEGGMSVDGVVTTYTNLDGMYLARLPHERGVFRTVPDDDVDHGRSLIESIPHDGETEIPAAHRTERVMEFKRRLSVFRLNDQALQKLIGLSDIDPLHTFPANFDNDLQSSDGPYTKVGFTLWDEVGNELNGEDGQLPMLSIKVGRRVRRDIRLP